MLLCAYAKLGYILYAVYPFPFVAKSPGVSSGFPTSSLYLASRLQKRDFCMILPRSLLGKWWSNPGPFTTCAVSRWTVSRAGCEIRLKKLRLGNLPDLLFLGGTWLDHPKPWGEFPWQAWWFSLDVGSQGFFFQSFGRDLQQWLPLQLRTEQWKDCFVQGMDSCILAAWHGRPEGLVGLGLLGSSGYLHLRENGWGGSRSVSK